MASESTDEGITVSLPGELDDWLTERARTLGVDRETVLLQLVSAYRAADELGDDGVPVRAAVDEAVADRLSDAADAVQQQVGEQVDAVESRCEEDIEDVRSRVVQLKRELDGKAVVDHGHEEFDRIDELADQLSEIEDTVEEIEAELDSTVAEHDVVIEDIDERVDTLQGRLKTVAWVVSDLREAHESQGGMEAVERIKRAAAKADIDRAKCESCGSGVDVSLLTDPECPHCESTVTNVETASGFFGSPRLLTASQLESGEDDE